MSDKFKVYVTPSALREIKELPGNVRQRVKRAVDKLAEEPRPSGSTALELPDIEYQVRRLRLDKWRLIYAVTESDDEKLLDVLAVRKRPPYDYADLEKLLEEKN